MSNYILLKDQTCCPKCRTQAVPKVLPARCRCCGMMLFTIFHDFEKYERFEGWREYWVWTGIEEGWKHRTQLLDEHGKPLKQSQALEREYKAPKLDDDYGTESYIERKIQESRIELKQRAKDFKKKIGIPHK